MNPNIWQRIQQFNQGRDQTLLKRKYQKMANNPFIFLRGSCHLFYEDWSYFPLENIPLAWICGDLHLENFGSYQGNNRLTYFDINDFDEGILAPCIFDVARLLTSIFLAFPVNENFETQILANALVQSYKITLTQGKARWIERNIADGLVRNLLDKAENKKNNPQSFLEKRTQLKYNHREIKIIEDKTYKIKAEIKDNVKKAVEKFGELQANPSFFKVLDVAGRIAGTGSLGLSRYVVLVEGVGSPAQNYLLDVKLAVPSCLEKYNRITQPHWNNSAERIIAIQKRAQAIEPAFLNILKINSDFYVMKELQPTEEKIDLEGVKEGNKLEEVVKLIKTLGQVLAWLHLRSSGRGGSSIADEFITFSEKTTWQTAVIYYAEQYSKKVIQDWQEFQNNITP